ncbi:sigma-70 family RNA polymerase sigma factor [Solirubrobacter sp. CPCC 204708]|uniref:Sigma-70 family RNA polymerase sigma factor n=1 Tax=Solirubrobacter deserti TaxID=2282478 RepID=A0ABT4RGG6_9ACTN|nr:RNA polymerase sigma factor [Solirubrobacter deserti]MBE2319652.1 sigma-70 family RNA polymerase sigma factor [Solirubrobacter deserti]MDA0137609.1 sigma-70 family RNA polymerase sigma factor [Solirubrobacter deserti]
MTAVPATLRLRRESTLRSRAARGDAAAFAAVYERHHQALYRYCRSILRHEEDAQDALQSTMTRAFAALQTEERDFELRPWLFRIAHNEAISLLRKRRDTTELDDIPVAVELDDQVSEREQLRLLAMDLADLPERQRAALVLRELNGLSHAEIAVVLETSAANVKQVIYEARTALFSAREGREMPCEDVRRKLSDGDGRVLRSRGLRAHLRSCSGCRAFQADIATREKRLALLAPPLPTAGAAALLAQILGGGTAKLLACVAIAGGGATVAATEFYKPPPAADAEAPPALPEREKRAAAPTTATATPTPVVTAAPTAAAASSAPERPAKKRPAAKKAKPKPKPKRERPRTVGLTIPADPRPGNTDAAGSRPAETPRAESPREDTPRTSRPAPRQDRPSSRADRPAPKADRPARKNPPKADKVKPEKAKPEKQKPAKPVEQPASTPPPAATATPVSELPPGQAKKQDRAEHVPPGQAKKQANDDEDDDDGGGDEDDDD